MKVYGPANHGTVKESTLKGSKKSGSSSSQGKKSGSTVEPGATEKVLFSSAAKDISKAKSIVANSPDIRAEKVKEIKDRIEKGEYHVSSREIAGKMLKELIPL